MHTRPLRCWGQNQTRVAAANNLEGRNLSKRPENRARNASPEKINRDLRQARPATGRANNVYADKSGAVARRTNEGSWETREQGQWKRDPATGKITPDTKQQAQSKASGMSPQQRDQAAQQARDKASKVPQDYQRPGHQQPQIDRRDLNRSHQARTSGMSRERARPHRAPARRR